ncbi:sigma 54-interacting transcriptional regulator, partial [Clostridiaceae bacterium HSG29]|nr:sigma 54-interacting transcriptional regulator [Clostridiaceae bacterium HSG29]
LILKSLKDYTSEINDLYNYDINVGFDDLIGNSKVIENIKKKIKKIAISSSTILVTGETGTGKEVVARLIHNNSKRKNNPFVAINCSAIPDDLLESELFGYEEGAFSGAKKGGKLGKFQLAEGGTIFLDEIGEMPIHLQSKILRVLEERKVTRIGGLKSTNIDIRVISATNKDLESLVEEGKFREDLLYRLKVIPIKIPPLRERKEDIKLLINYFLKIYSRKLDKNIIDISKDAINILLNNQWYGNIRELKNVMEFAINMADSNIITADNLPSDIKKITFKTDCDLNIENTMKKLIIEAIDRYGSTTQGKENAANALGISVATLYRKLIKYNLE